MTALTPEEIVDNLLLGLPGEIVKGFPRSQLIEQVKDHGRVMFRAGFQYAKTTRSDQPE